MQSLLGFNRRADVSFAPNGLIEISAKVAKLLALQRGDAIDIKTDGTEFYLYVRTTCPEFGRFEAQCFPSNRNGHHFRAYSARLCNALRTACGTEGKLRLAIGGLHNVEGRNCVALITKHNISS